MFFPVSDAMNKMPAETWEQYAPLFREYSTATITPELLAALAQVEGAGNPVASTYWRWRLTWNPFAVYQPASSAVGTATQVTIFEIHPLLYSLRGLSWKKQLHAKGNKVEPSESEINNGGFARSQLIRVAHLVGDGGN
jgi:hypothetical protein